MLDLLLSDYPWPASAVGQSLTVTITYEYFPEQPRCPAPEPQPQPAAPTPAPPPTTTQACCSPPEWIHGSWYWLNHPTNPNLGWTFTANRACLLPTAGCFDRKDGAYDNTTPVAYTVGVTIPNADGPDITVEYRFNKPGYRPTPGRTRECWYLTGTESSGILPQLLLQRDDGGGPPCRRQR